MDSWTDWWNHQTPTLEEGRERSLTNRFVRKHQQDFAKYFLPKHVFSVQLAYLDEEDDNLLHVVGRVRPAHQSTKGKTQKFEIDVAKYKAWKRNIKLYTFVSGN